MAQEVSTSQQQATQADQGHLLPAVHGGRDHGHGSYTVRCCADTLMREAERE